MPRPYSSLLIWKYFSEAWKQVTAKGLCIVCSDCTSLWRRNQSVAVQVLFDVCVCVCVCLDNDTNEGILRVFKDFPNSLVFLPTVPTKD